EFRRAGREAIDWIAAYRERVESLPVVSDAKPGDVRSRLPAHPPERGEPFESMMRDLDEIVMPGITHWQSPSFYAFFPGNSTEPAILGELLSAGLGVQGMMWATSPACTEVEQHMMDWLVELLDLPRKFRFDGPGGGVLQDTASTATLTAIVAARERATGGASNREGVRRPLVAYASREAHSSVEKAVRIAGIGSNNLRLVDTDMGTLAMEPEMLEAMIRTDLEAGHVPAVVVATVGTTGTTAIDPVAPIGEICRRYGAWLHVDAAFAGTAALCPEFRWIHDGLEHADSYCFNPHKWMLTNFDCSAFWVADRSSLTDALSVTPEYLRNPASESGAVVDYRDWHVQLGRRFRALKLWFVIRHYGAEGLRAHVREHVGLAQEFASWVRNDERFEVPVPHPLSLVCFRLRAGDDATRALMERVNAAGMYLTHTSVGGRMTLRLAIGGARTERRHVERAWERIRTGAP
ncbi:MAG: pyridoxal-dependent decarboxylase, partial [Actinomycetota bacterium]